MMKIVRMGSVDGSAVHGSFKVVKGLSARRVCVKLKIWKPPVPCREAMEEGCSSHCMAHICICVPLFSKRATAMLDCGNINA